MKRRIPQEGKQGESSKYVIQYLLLQQKRGLQVPSHKKKSLKKGYAIFALDCVEASETAEHGSTRKHKVNTRQNHQHHALV